MKIKSFYEKWTNQEIAEYLHSFNILVLFEVVNKASLKIKIYGDLSSTRKEQLADRIRLMFGGQQLNDVVCDKINEFAAKWYSKVVLNRPYRVINKTRRHA